MGASWLCARADLRQRWRTVVVLALLGGLGGGFALTALLGARRASTAWERFRVETLDSDAFVSIPSRPDPGVADELARLPGVTDATSFVYVAVSPKGIPEGAAFAAADDRFGRTVARSRLLEGRRADPARPDEVVVNPAMAAAAALRPGDRTTLEASGGQGFATDVTVVGVVVGANDLGVNTGLPAALLTPAFLSTYGDAVGTGRVNQFVRLDRGTAGIDDFRAALSERYASDGGVLVGDTSEETSGITDALRLQGIALALLGGAAGAATLLVVRQSLVRYAAAVASDGPALGALGMTLDQRTASASLSIGLVAITGAFVAAAGSVAASPLVPTGLAGAVEPDAGVKVDLLVQGGGGLVLALLVAAVGHAAVRRAMKLRRAGEPLRPSLRLPTRLGPAATVGLGSALGGGSPRIRAAVRSAIAAILVGSLAVTGASTFAASLDHLLGRPALYGWNFDALVGVGGEDPAEMEAAAAGLASDADVTRVTVADVNFASIGGQNVEILVLEERKGGAIHPTVVGGRTPSGAGEVMLGSTTMARLGIGLGDPVEMAGTDGPARLDVVGRGVFPVLGDGTMNDAAAISAAAASGLRLEESRGRLVMLTVRDGADPLEVAARHTDIHAGLPAVPSEVRNLHLVRAAPWVLAAFLGALAAAAVGHALISSVRAGRRDLAVLQALGFVRRQVQSTVLWQAAAIVAIGLVVGLPLGLAAGRWVWTLVAEGTGAIVEPVMATGILVATVPLAFALATVVAAVPAWHAGRLKAAAVLRAE